MSEDLIDLCKNLSLGYFPSANVSESVSQIVASQVNSSRRPGSAEVWGIGLVCVTIISSCSAVGIGLLPLLSKRLYYRVLTYCVGLGVGSLSGGALFHLLPQAFLGLQLDDQSFLGKSWMAVVGVYLFFLADRVTKFIVEYRRRRKQHGQDCSKYAHHELKKRERKSEKESNATPPFTFTPPLNSNSSHVSKTDTENTLSPPLLASNESFAPSACHDCSCENEASCLHLKPIGMTNNRSFGDVSRQLECDAIQKLSHVMCTHDHDVSFKQGDSVVRTVAWMILFGDGLHNFIDGLSIGAAFSESIKTGISVSVAVLCEEFPHELGDVAILLNAGMKPKQALVYNLLSASTCYLGFVLGVLVGELTGASSFIFPLAGGMFLYISLATMLPEMSETITKAMEVRMSKGVWVLCLQSLGIFTGLLLMYVMAAFGSQISFS